MLIPDLFAIMKRLKNYNIKGDISELGNIVNPKARLSTTLDDLLSVLSEEGENYVEVRFGENLSAAYQNATVSDRKCRLVLKHIDELLSNFYIEKFAVYG